jgi:FMN phosphatase YigB (HAD superfamily)
MNKCEQKLFFIDFDDTLFYTKEFKDDLIKVFFNNGISEKQFKDSYYCVDTETRPKYSPYTQIKKLEDEFGVDGKKLKYEFDDFIKNAKNYLFDDSVGFLKEIRKSSNYLVLLSYGECLFQKMKIDNTDIGKSFDQIIVTDEKKLNVILGHKKINSFENVFFIEDHPEQLDGAMKKLKDQESKLLEKIKIIKISRREGRYSKIKTKFNFEKFNNLREVLKKVC